MKPIKKLSKNVKSMLSASNLINSFTKAVQELVFNSFDANATSIAVRVHIDDGSIQVVDNGCGINKNDFEVLGHTHMSSKVTDISTLKAMPNTYGFRGQALASIVQVSKHVKITSRSGQSEDTFTKIFEYGKQKHIVGSKTRPSVGTTVEVEGFLYNLSIQKKCSNNVTALQEIKSFLQYTSLAQSNISMSLRDDSTNEIVFKIHKNRDIYQTLLSLYGIEKSDVQELQVEKNQYKVTAYIGKNNNDALNHLIFLNGKLIMGLSKIHKIVNHHLSICLKMDKAERQVKDMYNKEENVKNTNIPFYILFLKCPYNDYDVNTTSKHTNVDFKDWVQVNKLLEKLIKFYTGDITIKEIGRKPKTNDKNMNPDTRSQVKHIIDRILGSKQKNPQVSQMHNGVKGKQALRKRKKKLQLDIEPVKFNKLQQNRNDQTSPRTPDFNANQNNEVYFKNLSKNKGSTDQDKTNKTAVADRLKKSNKGISPIRGNNKKRNKSKAVLLKPKTKKNIKTVPLFSKFMNPTDSAKERINFFSKIATKIIKERNLHRQSKMNFIRVQQTVEHKNSSLNNNMTKTRKKINATDLKDCPIPNKSINIFNTKCQQNEKNHTSLLSTHDLFNTILKSQPEKTSKERENITKKKVEMQTNNADLPDSIRNHESPVITFQSHNYKNDVGLNYLSHDKNRNGTFRPIPENCFNVFKKPKAFLSKKSIENFGSFHGIRPNIFKRKFYKKINPKTDNWLKRTLNKALNETHFYDILNNFSNSNQQSSYRIQYSESESCNYIKYNINNNVVDSTVNTLTMNIEQSMSAYTLNHTPQSIDLSNHQIKSNYLFESDEFLRTINNRKLHNTIPATQKEQSFDFCYERLNNDGTYTVENNSYNEFVENTQSFHNIRYNDISLINATYNVDPINKTLNEKSAISCENEMIVNHVCSPKPPNALEISDPIQVCETIMDSRELVHKEFENSFNVANSSINIDNSKYTHNVKNNEKNDNINLEEISHHFTASQIPNLVSTTINLIENQLLNDNNTVSVVERNEIVMDSHDAFNFDIKDRLCFLPKGMSQIFQNCNSKTEPRCHKFLEDYYEEKIYSEFASKVQNTVEIFEPKIQEARDLVTKDIDKVNNKLKKDSASLKFDGQSVKDAKILGQVDQKFIAAVIKGDDEGNSVSEFLVLFDQHAVHERIRLETNLNEYLSDAQWKSVNLDEVTLKVTSDEIRFLHNFKEKFTQFGLQWNILSDNEILLVAIPEAIIGKNARPVDKIIIAVLSLIKEIINAIKLQSGCVSLYPKAIMDLVFSEACRYAIKFGDQLSNSECIELLRNLSECRTPFQCAHGRPVMAVLMDMKPINHSYKICPDNIKKFKKLRF